MHWHPRSSLDRGNNGFSCGLCGWCLCRLLHPSRDIRFLGLSFRVVRCRRATKSLMILSPINTLDKKVLMLALLQLFQVVPDDE